MKKLFSLKHMSLEVWLMETLRRAPKEGMTLEELQEQWKKRMPHGGVLSRTTLFRHRLYIQDIFGIRIDSPDKKHYRITNPGDLALDSLANDLLTSLQEYLFLDEYRDLGDKIQPQQIWNGLEFLHPIGDALRENRKLKVRYRKFTDSEPYEAVLHPYCLKASLGRWYLLAHKEEDGSGHGKINAQCFALDRTLSLTVLNEKFTPDKSIKVESYFKNAFGIWVDEKNFPVQKVRIEVAPEVASYLRTLPLHQSQKEMRRKARIPGWVIFQYRISPTPDFIGELRKWGEDVNIVDMKK